MSLVKLKRSTTTGAAPASLASGEIAINEADGKLFWRKSDNTVQSFDLHVEDGAPGSLNTLKKIADAIGDDASFSATVTAALGNRLRFDASQTLTSGQKSQAQSNLGLGSAATHAAGDFQAAGSYAALNGSTGQNFYTADCYCNAAGQWLSTTTSYANNAYSYALRDVRLAFYASYWASYDAGLGFWNPSPGLVCTGYHADYYGGIGDWVINGLNFSWLQIYDYASGWWTVSLV